MNRITSRAAILTACLFLTITGSRLSAQTLFGRISGTVTDQTGAVIAGAKVTITDTDTQAVRTAIADDKGFYVTENLPIGPYSVSADQAGFKRTEQSGFQVVADGHVTANLQLQIGEASQTVEVVAANEETLNTVSGEVAHTIDKGQLENLPLNGRNYMELLSLVPGVTVTNPDTFSINTSLSATNQVVNGHRSNQNNMTVDGVGNMDGGSNGSLINNVSPDFMQQVKIQTSNFSAEYGRSTGASFNLVTKNGTDTFHGGAFETFRNDALDARNFFSPNQTELRYNDFGWNLGGPIKKGKLFFFAGEEWKRLRQQAAPTRVTLPSLAELQGNFLGSGKTINMPGTKTPYPNDAIPTSQLTPDGIAVANVFRTVIPLAAVYNSSSAAATAGNNATFENPNPLNYREDLGRFDYVINDKHRLFGRWVDDYNVIYLADGPGGSLPITPENRNRPGKSFLVSETWLINPTLVNEAHLGASWNGQRYQNLGTTWQRADEGFAFQRVYNSVGAWATGIPTVSISNFTGCTGPSQTLSSPTTEIEAVDTLSIVKGQHSIRTGVMIIRNRKDQNGRSLYDGSIAFATTTPNTTGYAMSDALLSNFSTYTEAAYDPIGFYRYTEPSVFVDDSWKVSRKLTINLGMRYEYMMAMYSTANNLTDFVPSMFNFAQAVKINSSGQVVPNSGNIYDGLQRVSSGIASQYTYVVPNADDPAVLAVPSGAPRGMYPSQGEWQPRLGFAFALNDKTVFRGGYGMFYDRIQGNPTFYTLNNPPYVGSASFNNGNLSNIAGGAAVSAPWGTIQTIDKNMKVPYTQQFSFGIQRNLPFGLFAESDLIGTLGRHLLVEPDINQPSWAVLGSVPTSTNLNSIRPYPGYSTIQMFQSEATSNYYGLQLKLSRQVALSKAGSVSFTSGYTFAKVLTDASSDTQNDENNFNIKTFYGPASFDVRHVFFATAFWNLPTLRHHRAYLRDTAGGWVLSGVVHLQSGFYYTPVGNNPAILSGSRVADYLGLPTSVDNPGPNGTWSSFPGWNRAAYKAAPVTRWGTSGAGVLEGPGMQIYNLSLAKAFTISESRGISMRVRADLVNAFNHANFQGPQANSSDSTFGTVTAAYPARNIQLGIRLTF